MSDVLTRIAAIIDANPGMSRLPATLLMVLTDAKGRIVTRSQIIEAVEEVYGRDCTGVDVTAAVKRLRACGVAVQPVYGVGYRLQP